MKPEEILEKRVRINSPAVTAKEATEDQPAVEAQQEHRCHGCIGKVVGYRSDENGETLIVDGTDHDEQAFYLEFKSSQVEVLSAESA